MQHQWTDDGGGRRAWRVNPASLHAKWSGTCDAGLAAMNSLHAYLRSNMSRARLRLALRQDASREWATWFVSPDAALDEYERWVAAGQPDVSREPPCAWDETLEQEAQR